MAIRAVSLSVVVVVVVLGVLVAPARADDLRDRAHAEFTAAQVDFDAGRFQPALDHLQRAYALAPHPELLFNIARCLEELKRPRAAVDAYDRYLAVQPNDGAARERVATLREQLRANPPPPEAPTPPDVPVTAPTSTPASPEGNVLVAASPAPAKRPVYRRWWLWTAVGGAVAVGLGVGLGVGLTHASSPPTFPALTAQ